MTGIVVPLSLQGYDRFDYHLLALADVECCNALYLHVAIDEYNGLLKSGTEEGGVLEIDTRSHEVMYEPVFCHFHLTEGDKDPNIHHGRHIRQNLLKSKCRQYIRINDSDRENWSKTFHIYLYGAKVLLFF